MYIIKEDLLEAIEREYGNLEDDSGAYSFVDGEYKWLSVKAIVNIINEMMEWDED